MTWGTGGWGVTLSSTVCWLAFATAILPKAPSLRVSCLDSSAWFFVCFCIVLFIFPGGSFHGFGCFLTCTVRWRLRVTVSISPELHLPLASNSLPAASKAAEVFSDSPLHPLPRSFQKQAGNCQARPGTCSPWSLPHAAGYSVCETISSSIFSSFRVFLEGRIHLAPVTPLRPEVEAPYCLTRVGTVRRGFFLEDLSYRRKIRARVVGGWKRKIKTHTQHIHTHKINPEIKKIIWGLGVGFLVLF